MIEQEQNSIGPYDLMIYSEVAKDLKKLLDSKINISQKAKSIQAQPRKANKKPFLKSLRKRRS